MNMPTQNTLVTVAFNVINIKPIQIKALKLFLYLSVFMRIGIENVDLLKLLEACEIDVDKGRKRCIRWQTGTEDDLG